MGGICHEQYLVMIERDNTTNTMQNTNGEIPDVAGYGDCRRGTYTVGIVGTFLLFLVTFYIIIYMSIINSTNGECCLFILSIALAFGSKYNKIRYDTDATSDGDI